MATAYGDMGSQQGIRAVSNGVAVGGKFRIYTGSGTPLSTFSATEVGDLYMDYTNGILYIATATGSASWQAYASGIQWKAPVRVATVSAGTLATSFANGQTVDGKTLVTGDRILIKNQVDQTANGVYTVNATGAPTRAMDADTGAEILGLVVAVLEGTVNEDSAWVNTNSTAITIGSSNITFAIFGGQKAGNGILFTADVVEIDTAVTCDLTTLQAITGKSKLAIVSQSAAYNDSALQVGVYGSGIADTVLADNILVSFVNKSGTNKTSADTSSMTMYVGNSTTAAVTNNKMQCILSSMTVAHNVFDAYAVQGHIAVTGNSGTQNANAHVTGISGKASVSTSKTLATGWLTAGLFILEGAGAVTQMCSVVSIVQEAGTNLANPMLYINNDGTATKGIQFVGNFTTGIQIPAMTIGITSAAPIRVTATSPSYDASALSVGVYGTAIADTLTADNILVSFVNSSGVNKSSSDTSSMTVYVGNSTTAAVANNKMQGVLSSMGIGHNIFDAYAGQFHTTVSASMATANDNAHITGVSAKLKFSGTPTVSKGWLTAGLFIVEGTGTASQMCHGVSIVEEAGTTGPQSLLHLNTDVGTTPYFSFAGADGTGKSIYTHTAAGTQLGTIKILVNGADKWIPFMQAE